MAVSRDTSGNFSTPSETRGVNRRSLIKGAAAAGLAVPIFGNSARIGSVFAQDATQGGATLASDTDTVGIVNKAMTMDEIKAAVADEGSVNVGNWTYTANDTLVARFKEYVKATYDVDIALNYEATQAPSIYITGLYTALASGNAPSYDVMAFEENYWAEAMSQPESVVQEFLPSALVPNADRLLDQLKHVPTSIGFQASASPGIVYDKERAPYLQDWTDLADERLKGRLTLPRPGDITAGGFLLGLCSALDLDYTDPAGRQGTVDYIVQKIHPNVVQYTSDSATMQQLLRNGVVDAVSFWNSLARMEFLDGQPNTAFMVAKSGQYLANGYMWIPKNAPHPILAQIFVNWRISDDVQFPPESWGLGHGPWAELNEGLIGPSYESLVPEWFAADYYSYYPTIEQLETNYKTVDWDIYTANAESWMDAYAKGIGQ